MTLLNYPNHLVLADVEYLTRLHGQEPAITHARRLLRLVEHIGAGLVYDRAALEIAIYLHDWGAYPHYVQSGLDHALRSRQVAEVEILPRMNLSAAAVAVILEAIERHDYRDMQPVVSPEALLLREADFLDFLGLIGMAREFARDGKSLAASLQRVIERRGWIEGRFSLPAAQALAAQRLERMERALAWLQEESFGYL